MSALVNATGLTKHFPQRGGGALIRAVDGVDFTLDSGETLALVGESGSGKSLTALAIMGLLPIGAAATGGQILIGDEDLLRKTREQLVATRGRRVACTGITCGSGPAISCTSLVRVASLNCSRSWIAMTKAPGPPITQSS